MTSTVNRRLLALTASIVVLLASGKVFAGTPKTFIALMDSRQVSATSTSQAFGHALLTFNDATDELCYRIVYGGLSGVEVGAGIFVGPIGDPPTGLFPLPPGNPKSGCFGLVSSWKKALLKNQLSIGIVSAASLPDAEIRGQILRIK